MMGPWRKSPLHGPIAREEIVAVVNDRDLALNLLNQ